MKLLYIIRMYLRKFYFKFKIRIYILYKLIFKRKELRAQYEAIKAVQKELEKTKSAQ